MSTRDLPHWRQALRLLRGAAAELREIGDTARSQGRWTDAATAQGFASQVAELIACDDGEAGLEPYVAHLDVLDRVTVAATARAVLADGNARIVAAMRRRT